ncbi:MAG: P-loop NTPase [Candidatus Altiarchaeota archaeon]|nr:P-loop NTPase [Candidatus Altiarchaeota archaeon]
MRIIALTAGKGGVGKTTLTANLGVSLTKMGFKTCVLDANFTAPDLGTHFGLNPDTTIWDVLNSKEPIEHAIYGHDCGLHIIPGSTGVEDFRKDIYKRLKRKIRNLKYDFLLIDTPPGLGDDAISALTPAKEVIIVANPEWTSLSNAYRVYQIAKKMKKQVVGMVLNRQLVHEYEPDGLMIKKFTGLNVIGEIPEDIVVRKSIAVQSPVTLSYPESKAAKELERISALIGGIDYKSSKGWFHNLMKFIGMTV